MKYCCTEAHLVSSLPWATDVVYFYPSQIKAITACVQKANGIFPNLQVSITRFFPKARACDSGVRNLSTLAPTASDSIGVFIIVCSPWILNLLGTRNTAVCSSRYALFWCLKTSENKRYCRSYDVTNDRAFLAEGPSKQTLPILNTIFYQ